MDLPIRDEYLPADHQDAGDDYIGDDLHYYAGLTESGLDEDGNIQWLGDKKAWDKFDELTKQEEEQIL